MPDQIPAQDVAYLRDLLTTERDHLAGILKENNSARLQMTCKAKFDIAQRWLDRLDQSFPKGT